PMAQWGTHAIMGRYSKKISLWPLRKPVDVLIGDPIDLSDLAGRENEPAALNEATRRLMDAITALVADLREEEAPAQRWNPSEHGQQETGRFDA
ncbi:MAG TPA: 1-acyl-sn-glycerol-3-phosphate acyltransferase, partial [Brevibacterium sp.]|nr:1-acyl-sn-glycerol-3-phosphate acyltransferase [Brevibacterium sp.]